MLFIINMIYMNKFSLYYHVKRVASPGSMYFAFKIYSVQVMYMILC